MKHPLISTLITALASFGLCTTITNGLSAAKSISADEVARQSYVIGKHVFTRDQNESTGYRGYIDTRAIMLAAKSIEGNTLEDMKIYYKMANGTWVDSLSGDAITAVPETFDIEYKNLGYNITTPTLTAVSAGLSVEYGEGMVYPQEVIENHINTISYELTITNADAFVPSASEPFEINAVEFLVQKSDLDETVPELNCTSQVSADGVEYCPLGSSELAILNDNQYKVATPIARFGKTYHFAARVAYTYDGKHGYSELSEIATVTAPMYYNIEFVSEENAPSNYGTFVAAGETVKVNWNMNRLGYHFEGFYVAEQCGADEEHNMPLYCSTDTAYDLNAPVNADLVLIEKWTALAAKVEITPTDPVGSIDGHVKVYLGENEFIENTITDEEHGISTTFGYVAYAGNSEAVLFNSTTKEVNLAEIEASKDNIRLVFVETHTTAYSSNEIPQLTFEHVNTVVLENNLENESSDNNTSEEPEVISDNNSEDNSDNNSESNTDNNSDSEGEGE